jgi:hypothetical protein
MTIKQILIGTLVGTSIIGFAVHRFPSLKGLQARTRTAIPKLAHHDKVQPRKVAHLHHKKSPWFSNKKKSSDPQLSSGKLY